jgi:hypothetical protein
LAVGFEGKGKKYPPRKAELEGLNICRASGKFFGLEKVLKALDCFEEGSKERG